MSKLAHDDMRQKPDIGFAAWDGVIGHGSGDDAGTGIWERIRCCVLGTCLAIFDELARHKVDLFR
jgi:hypothetical protein